MVVAFISLIDYFKWCIKHPLLHTTLGYRTERFPPVKEFSVLRGI